MADKSIKYTVTADDNPFAAGMKRVGEVLNGVQQRFGATGRDFKAIGESMSAQVAKITDSVRSEVSSMGGHFSTLLDSVGATRAGFIGLVAAAAGLAAAKAVNATAEMTEGAMDLARALGTSTNEAQRWKIALEDVGASQGDLEGAAKGMARQLKENEDDMRAMGLATRDASGNLRPMNELLVDGLAILNQHKEGADRALAAQQLFGRGVDASSKLLLVNNEVLDDATHTMQDLSLEVGENAVAAWKDYDAATDRAGFSVKGLVATVGKILMPAMTDLVNVFNAVMPAAITVVRGALGGLTTAFHAIKNGVVVVWETINAMVVTVAEPIRALAEAIARAVAGDFEGAGAAIKGIGTTISTSWGQAMDRMAESSKKTHDRIAAIWSSDTGAGQAEGERGSKTYVAPPDKNKKEKRERQSVDPSFMQYYEAALAREKRLAAEKDALREYTKEQELAFWKNLLQNADLVGKDRVAITKKVADLEVQLLREAAKQKQALDAELLRGKQQAALDAVEAARIEAQGQYALGEMSNQQLLELERQLEEQRTEIRRQYLQARLAMIDPDRDPVAYEQTSQQIEELERQHRMRLRQIQIEQEAAVRAPMANVWAAAEQSMAAAVNGMINRTMTLRQALTSVWQGIRTAIVGEIAKIIAAKIAAYAKERLLSLAKIGTNAVEAGSGAAASQASIPYVGPILAIAAMAAVMGAVMSSKGSVPSAAQGWSIPAGVNPLTQLHEREMVLPADIADPLRENLAGGSAGAPSAPPVLQITGHSAGDLFIASKRELAAALKALQRDHLI